MNRKNNRPDQAPESGLRAEEITGENALRLPEDTAALSLEDALRMIHQLREKQTELEKKNAELRESKAELEFLQRQYSDLFDKDAENNPMGRIVMRDITERKRADETLRYIEERYRSFFEQGPDGIVVLDPITAKPIEFNDQVCRQLGYSREEFAQLQISDIEVKESAEETRDHIQKVLKEGYDQFETLQKNKQGEIRHVHVIAQTLKFNEQPVYHCIWRDITERKRAEDELKKRETTLQAVFDTTPVGICIMKNRVYQRANRDWCESFGYSEENLIGRTTEFLYESHEEYERIGKELYSAIQKKGIAFARTRLKRSDGEYRDVELMAKPLVSDVLYADTVVVVQDITERKRTEEKLIRQQQAIEQTSECIVISDSDGTIQYVNPAFEQITGYTHDEVVGRNPRILKSGLHDAAFYKEMWKTLMRGDTWKGRLVNRKKNGTLYTEEATISPVRDVSSGKTVNYVAVKSDITEKIKLEEQYHQIQKMESIGRLAGGVAHDLNNLLTPILGYSEMLLYDFGPEDSRKRKVEQIVQAGFRARDLVQQLLAFSRKQPLEFRPVDMNKAITGFEKLIRRTIREDIEIKTNLTPDTHIVMGDIGHIEQVIMNLAVNAADAMPQGGCLTIQTASVSLDRDYAATHPDVKPGKYVMLAVSDTGDGMDKETQKHIFEPFFSTKGERGTGLGLSTVYGIVKQHAGSIGVYSEANKGTTFKVFLPVLETPPIEERTGKTTFSEMKGSETILLVEDSKPVRDLCHTALTRQGYTVLSAENGVEALTLLSSHSDPIDLLLTDVIMPGMNGKELFIKAAKKHRRLKALFMSGYISNGVSHQGILEQGGEFIRKPFTGHGLAMKVREVLGKD